MPKVYGYIRVSHVISDLKGISPEAQRMQINYRWEYEQRKGTVPDHQFGLVGWEGGKKTGIDTTDGFFVDRAVSAMKTRLTARPAGHRLNTILQRGDIVIFAHLDRAFRNLRDFANQTKSWMDRGIQFVFCSPDVDMRTPYGQAFAATAAVWSELDSRLKSERIKESMAYQRKQLRKTGRSAPIGFRIDPRNPKRIVPDNNDRRQCARIAGMMAIGRPLYTLEKIARIFEAEEAEREGRPVRRAVVYRKREKAARWNRDRVFLALKQWKAGNIPPPTDEPLPQWWIDRCAKLGESPELSLAPE